VRTLDLLPAPPVFDDVRLADAVAYRRREAAAWVRSWTFRRNCQRLADAFGISVASAATAVGHAMRAFAADADLADAELEVAADAELAELWSGLR